MKAGIRRNSRRPYACRVPIRLKKLDAISKVYEEKVEIENSLPVPMSDVVLSS